MLAAGCSCPANCLPLQGCYLKKCSTFKEGSGADGGEGAENMWALTNQIAPTMASMTLVRLIALERIPTHALTLRAQPNATDHFQVVLRYFTEMKQRGMPSLMATQWRDAFRTRGETSWGRGCVPVQLASHTCTEILRKRIVSIVGDGQALGIDGEAALAAAAAAWRQDVMDGKTGDTSTALALPAALVRTLMLLDIDRSRRNAIQNALLASLGSDHLSKRIRKAEEKRQIELEARLGVSAVTRDAWRASAAGQSACREFVQTSLVLARREVEQRARLTRLAYEKRQGNRDGGGSGRLRFACVPFQRCACYALTASHRPDKGVKSFEKRLTVALKAERGWRIALDPGDSAEISKERRDALVLRGALPWAASGAVGAGAVSAAAAESAKLSVFREYVDAAAKRARNAEQINVNGRRDAMEVLKTLARMDSYIRARIGVLEAELLLEQGVAADNAWAARALANRAKVAALEAASCRAAEIVADAQRRWSRSALRTSHKRETIPPLLTPAMFAACRSVAALERGVAGLAAEAAAPPSEPLVDEEAAPSADESSDSSEFESESDSDEEEEEEEAAGVGGLREDAGQAGAGGTADMDVDSAAAADAGPAAQAAPAEPVHIHAGAGCCATQGGAGPFWLAD